MYRGAPIGDVKARIAHCLKDWDAKTHMTKQEWERTCQRVTENQNKFLQEHAYIADDKKSKPLSK